MISYLFQDWAANAGNPKGRSVLALFRLCQLIRRLPAGLWLLGAPVLAVYVLLVHWIMGIEIDYRSEVGPGLALYHGTGLVVHASAKIGADCVLRNGVTIGERRRGGGCPVLENDVELGVNAVLLGPIRVGAGAVVGAGSVVLRDVSPQTVVAGNPAVEVNRRNEADAA